MATEEPPANDNQEPEVPAASAPRRAQPWRISRPVKKLLEEVYDFERHPSSELRRRLAVDCGVTPRQIQLWFQNRRYREKGQKLASQNSPSEDSPVERLAACAAATREAAEKARDQTAIESGTQEGFLAFSPAVPMCCVAPNSKAEPSQPPMVTTTGQPQPTSMPGGFVAPYYMQAPACWSRLTQEQELATLASAQSTALRTASMQSGSRPMQPAMAHCPVGLLAMNPSQQPHDGGFATSHAPAVALVHDQAVGQAIGGPRDPAVALACMDHTAARSKPWIPMAQPTPHLDMRMPMAAPPGAAAMMPSMMVPTQSQPQLQPQSVKRAAQLTPPPAPMMLPVMGAPIQALSTPVGYSCAPQRLATVSKDPMMPPNLSKLPPQLLSTQYLMQVYDDSARRRQLNMLASTNRTSDLI